MMHARLKTPVFKAATIGILATRKTANRTATSWTLVMAVRMSGNKAAARVADPPL